MAFLSGLKSALAKVSLKRKPGGTLVGNMLRSLVHKKTNGVFGNGAMLQNEGESDEDYKQRMTRAAAAAATTFADEATDIQNGGTAGTFMENVKAGVISAKLKRFAPIALAVLGLVIVIRIIKGKKSKHK